MDYNIQAYKQKVTEHYISNWGTDFEERRWTKGPIKEIAPDFTILEFKPTSNRKMWTYATCGMSYFTDSAPIELHLFSSIQDEGILELLTVVCHYHNTGHFLGLGHTVNFGRSWQDDSKASYGFVSLPYLDGPTLEVLELESGKQLSFYWLIPITKEELELKKKFGIEELEKKFDETEFNYLDPNRSSVV